MKYILYGCGKNIYQAISYFEDIGKRENIIACVDSDNNKLKTSVMGYIVEKLDDVYKNTITDDSIIVITPSGDNALNIARYLEKIGVKKYVYFEIIKSKKSEEIKKMELCSNDEIERISLRQTCMILEIILNKQRSQVEFLINHTQPQSIVMNKGIIRETQIELSNFAKGFLPILYKEGIRPILSAGNLLGLYRHGGFIPWDDDLDFKLLREEYDKLVMFCKDNFWFYEYDGRNLYKDYNGMLIKWGDSKIKEHPKEIIAIQYPYHLQIIKGNAFSSAVSIDFFSIDSFNDDYMFSDFYEYVKVFGKKIKEADTTDEQRRLIKTAMLENNDYYDLKGNNLYYGFDNFESYDYYVVNADWLQRKDVFPLHEKVYEGVLCYVPNNIERCLEYVFGKDYMSIPSDFTPVGHKEIREEDLIKSDYRLYNRCV